MTDLFFSVSSKPGNFGKTLYNSLFKKYGYNGLYIPVGLSSGKDFMNFCYKMRPIVKGISVSMPFKNLAYELGDSRDKSVLDAESANTLFFDKQGHTHAYNTDDYGFCKACESVLESGMTCLVYGSGAVSKTICCALKRKGIYYIQRKSRDNTFTAANMFINTTPVGMDGIEDNIFTEEVVRKYDYIFDVVVKKETNLKHLAWKAGKQYIGGIRMSKFQFIKQFEIYTGIKPNEQDVDRLLKENGYV